MARRIATATTEPRPVSVDAPDRLRVYRVRDWLEPGDTTGALADTHGRALAVYITTQRRFHDARRAWQAEHPHRPLPPAQTGDAYWRPDWPKDLT